MNSPENNCFIMINSSNDRFNRDHLSSAFHTWVSTQSRKGFPDHEKIEEEHKEKEKENKKEQKEKENQTS